MMPLSNDVSCSSVHGSVTMESLSASGFDAPSGCAGVVGVCWRFSAWGVEAPCDESRSFFLGGICNQNISCIACNVILIDDGDRRMRDIYELQIVSGVVVLAAMDSLSFIGRLE